ncbi:MarR family winged helix-turn-helix transcriptional regulator [Nocardioides stalactiti]|uniref:MarR family winged helix-turn-helix transcriptional regulator n=1 Tax=Nocardioides stalactiti TaxID=2755356 RepID=UPI001600ED85|nr:MarR family winged helix-turn-helix transcriptional regulator [Nocardioides stalactiti]
MTTDPHPSHAETLRLLEQEVGVLVRRVRRVIGQRALAIHPDLQPVAYLMLGYVLHHGPVRASALCQAFDMDKGSVSRQVQTLLDLGLLDRAPDPADGRATLLSVTEEGERGIADVSEHRRKLLAERLGDWTEDDLTQFVGLLSLYNAALSDD